jgi:hypothetical protein
MTMSENFEDWTIDTVVLYDCARLDTIASTFLLNILHKKKGVTFDKDKYIDKQYRKCLKETQEEYNLYPANALIKKWFIEVINKLAVINSGHLHYAHEKALRDLKFHDDDLKFVAVCHCSESRRLVSSDSDYSEIIKTYLKSEMSIEVLSAEEAITVLERPTIP